MAIIGGGCNNHPLLFAIALYGGLGSGVVFHTKLAYLFDAQRGHRLVLHLTSAKRPEKRFHFPFGSGAFNHFYCQLLKAGMSATEWRDAIDAVIAIDGLFQPLPSLDLDNEDITRFMGEMRTLPTLA